MLFLLQSVENHRNVGEACDSELLAEIRKMQKKMDVMEETISKLTNSKTGDGNGMYMKLVSSNMGLVARGF